MAERSRARDANQGFITGRVTRDPELRQTQKGGSIATIGIASNYYWRNKEGEEQEEVTYLDVSCFGKFAEAAAQRCTKGTPVFVQYRLRTDQWKDKNSGEPRSKLSAVMETLRILARRDQDSEPVTTTVAKAEPKAVARAQEPEDESIPF